MAEYIERESFKQNICAADICRKCQKKEFDQFPAADVAEVVRCEDCEYAERYERTNGTAGYYCGHPKNRFTYGERWDRVFKPVKEANDFCSYGEYQTNMGGMTNE